MLVKYNSLAARKVRGTAIAKGQPLWAVRKEGLYFIWSYSDEAFARQMDDKLSGPKNLADQQANWRRNLGDLCPSDRKSFA